MLTLVSVLDRTMRQHGNKTAIVEDEGSFTWAEFGDRVARGAGMLQKLGIGQGDRFGVLSNNSFRYTELLYAGYWMGAIPVPINSRLAPPEVRYILDDADCKILFIEDQHATMIESSDVSPWASSAVLITTDQSVSSGPDYESLLAAAEAVESHQSAEDDLALLLYTGGTTGRSKGVRLSHQNIVSNGMQVALTMKATSSDVYLHIAPMFHAADLLATAFVIVGGAHSHLASFTPNGVLNAFDRHGVTVTMMAPTMIIMLLQDGDFENHNYSSLRHMMYGSSPMAAEWTQKTIERFQGCGLQQGYGLTETSPILTTLDPPEHQAAVSSGDATILRSIGRAVSGVDLLIMNDDGEEMPLGGVGELVVRGPNIAMGYLNRPEETEKAFHDGWFHTGDVGRIDEYGYVFLMDRKKDMVITGGENVYTSEVEAVLYQHPDVNEAAVIGVPDDKYGEALFAVIVPAPGKMLTVEAILEHCQGKIGRYKIPRQMDFVSEMPKSAMGKILKSELRTMYGS